MDKTRNKSSSPKTFQYKLVFCNFAIVICIALAISLYNYKAYTDDMLNNAAENSSNRIDTLSERLDIAYNEIVNILVNCAERKSTFFANSYMNAPAHEDHKYNLYASGVLRDLCAVSGYSNYIYKITIYQKDLFTLQAGSSFGNTDDPQNIMDAPWFYEYLTQTTSQYSLKLVDNPFTLSGTSSPKLLPMLRPLKYADSSIIEDAWVFLAVSPKLYEDSLNSSSSNHIYAVTLEGDIIASKDSSNLPVSDLILQLLKDSRDSGNFKQRVGGAESIISFCKQPYSGILLFEVIPTSELSFDHSVIINTILLIFLFCIVIGLSLALLLSRQLTAPINRLMKRLEIISTGNFEHDAAIETNDELGVIGKQINSMSSHISELLESRIQGEKEKKDLEIKMLQAQINPHFLYNTLDSIKWIATMQKNTGIVQVVTALSSLLKNMAKGFNEKVTLRQELDFLENYVIIEKIRYIELFDVEITVDAPVLYGAKIIKLTLQPIVENAIFSGIEPSGRFGLIQIHAYAKNGILYITVTDNGIGITPENIEKLLTDTSRVTRSNMSGIGLPNVDRRMKLVYGEDYGITIESELDSFTKVTIALPLEY